MSRHDLALAQESCRGHGTFSPLLTANGVGGLVHPESENSMGVSQLGCRMALVGTAVLG